MKFKRDERIKSFRTIIKQLLELMQLEERK